MSWSAPKQMPHPYVYSDKLGVIRQLEGVCHYLFCPDDTALAHRVHVRVAAAEGQAGHDTLRSAEAWTEMRLMSYLG